jgi:hypothetical protein
VTTTDLDATSLGPILVYRAAGLPASDAGWQLVQDVEAISTRRACGNDLGSTELVMRWGEIHDPNRADTGLVRPEPPLNVDDCIRLCESTIDAYGQVVPGAERWVGVVESIDWGDPFRASVKAVDLGVLLARTYTTRGWELNHNAALMVDPGYLPPFNAMPGGDCSATDWETGYRIHDRRGSSTTAWTAFKIAELLLRRGMRADLDGAPGATAVAWKLDPASAGDYTPDCLDLHNKNLAECMDALFGSRRGLTWRVTNSGGVAQVLVLDLDATGTAIDTTADLAWRDVRIQERRDGYDWVEVSGARPLIGMTLFWKRGSSVGSLEPDGWDPATADTALNAAATDELAGKPYDRPEWRRFKLRAAWDGSNLDTASMLGSSTLGLRNVLVDPNTYAPPNGTRWFLPPTSPPSSLAIERETPAGQGFTALPSGPRQPPVVLAGKSGTWQDLSKECRPTPVQGPRSAERSDQGSTVILLGDTAEDAIALRDACGSDGYVLVTIGVREWAPLKAAWAAPQASWSGLSPRTYALRRPQIEQHLCLAGTVTGITNATTLATVATELSIRDDLTKLRTVRDQLAVRYGRAIVGASVTYQDGIEPTWHPGAVCSTMKFVDGEIAPVDMPCAEVVYEWQAPRRTTLRFAPLLKEVPSA